MRPVARDLGALAAAFSTALLATSVLVATAGVASAGAPTVRVAVVLDFGPRSAVRPTLVTRCLRVRAGGNGTDVLAALAALDALPSPSYASSGLLCTIDGYPSGGCGAGGSDVAYWSYWHGGARWTYASVGPATYAVTAGDVEGWRFEAAGQGSSEDPPPRTSPSFASVCDRDAVVPTGLPSSRSSGSGPWVTAAVLAVAAVLLVLAARRWRRTAT